MITRLKVNKFTAFDEMDITFSKGVNIFIGENATGKTHILKMLYSTCYVADSNIQTPLSQKINNVFLPDGIGRLARRSRGVSSGSFTVYRNDDDDNVDRYVKFSVSTKDKVEGKVTQSRWKKDYRYNVVYIPVKDMLANAPGFRSLYALRNLSFEEIYNDIIDRALLPAPVGKPTPERQRLMHLIEKAISGRIVVKQEHFYLKNPQGQLEFTLLAEGYRKLGLLYSLIQNETLSKSSILFWDEPEANLNPKLARTIVEIILELQRMGVQVFLATHDYVILKEFDLAAREDDAILYHSLYKDNGTVRHSAASQLDEVEHSAIDATYDDLLDRDIKKRLR